LPMPSAEQVYEDLEQDRATREAEIRLVERYYSDAPSDSERAMLARSLVLLTYAHVEGFTKFALLAYIGAINAMKIPCHQAALPLVAATLGKLFAALQDVNSKHPQFRDVPSGDEVHLQGRHLSFIANYDAVMAQVVSIPDSAVDTAANLNSRMLKRALFRIGLDLPALDEHHGTLNRLLGERNAIAHGDRIKVPKREAIESYLDMTFKLMLIVQQEIFMALTTRTFYRKAANYG
jgi:hypothetical protein